MRRAVLPSGGFGKSNDRRRERGTAVDGGLGETVDEDKKSSTLEKILPLSTNSGAKSKVW